MPRTLNLPPQLLDKIEDSGFDKQWRANHNFNSKRKSRKEFRKQSRDAKKQNSKPSITSGKVDKRPDLRRAQQIVPGRDVKDKGKSKDISSKSPTEIPKKKLKSDEFMRPFLSAHEEAQKIKEYEDEKYYAKKLGLKSTDVQDEGDGLHDLLDYEKYDDILESDDRDSEDSDDSDGNESNEDGFDGFDEDEQEDEQMTVEETMAKLIALKKRKAAGLESVNDKSRSENSPVADESTLGFDDDSLSEGDFSEDDGMSEDEDEEMTPEETMKKLAALKGAKLSNKFSESSSFSDLSADESLSEDEGLGEIGEEMTVEETMAKLAALKAKKNKESLSPSGPRNDIEDSDLSDSDGDSDANPYVPPTRRSVAPKQHTNFQASEAQLKVQRKFKSSLNKLTESNLVHVFNEIQVEFANNSRAETSEIFSDLIIELISGPQPLQHTMYTTYAGLVAALYQSQGVEFAAQLCQKLVPAILQSTSESSSASTNLLSLLVEMHCLHVVGSKLMYDLLKLWLENLGDSEIVVEMLLVVVRGSGSQLRSEDPVALKEVIMLVQQRMQLIADSITTRTRFMMDSIIALKNNRQKPVSELVVSLRHRIRKSIVAKSKVAKDPLQVGLNDILQSETQGKWWLVGASWKGHDFSNINGKNENDKLDINLDTEFGSSTPDWLDLAKKQRLNTDARRAVFVALMGAEDYLDACIRIDKLGLKNKQERDIPHVILHCLTQENIYNPFYALVSGKQCSKRSLMKTFQFRLWDWLNSEESSSTQVAMHYARFYASLVVQKIIGLDILKMANFLGNSHRIFLEVFLVSVYKDFAKQAEAKAKSNAQDIVVNRKDTPRDGKELTQMLTKIKNEKVLQGLTLWNSKLTSSEAVQSKKERARVQWAVHMVDSVIAELVNNAK